MLLILVAALGYFVDLYDLILFSVIRVKSLKDIGFSSDADIFENGVYLLNMQMAGMLIGGILWGILGDKKGRLTVLFGSILMYSLANIANGFVTNITAYAIIRFVAGIGLAGELGAGITLVSESMRKDMRGYGTALVAGVGLSGAIVAALVGDVFSWQTSFFIGGSMGLALLLLRIGVFESGLFDKIKHSHIAKGNFLMLFNDKKRFFKYLNCILIATPVWFVVGILVTFAPELGKALGIAEPLSGGKGILYAYIGISVGDVFTGFLSQWLQSRKKVMWMFLTATLASVVLCLYGGYTTANTYYIICCLLGFVTGFWAVFVTIASEQFGTNLRATVTTSVPNIVRGSVVLITISFNAAKVHFGFANAAMIVGSTTLLLAFVSLYFLDETYGKDLDYLEE